MKKEDLIPQKNFCSPKISSIGVEKLNECIELDRITLNGLWTKAQWLKELTDKNRNCFGIYCDSKLIAIACGWLILDELQITAIGVHPKYRMVGLGKIISSYLLINAKLNGAKKAILEVKVNNFAARSLYTKLGFVVIGTRKNFYKDGNDALIFSCDLTCKSFEEK